MVNRVMQRKAGRLLDCFPVMAILGARQVGKTTLARGLGPEVSACVLDLFQKSVLSILNR